MSNTVKDVSEALLDLLKYLDTPPPGKGQDSSPLSKFMDYRRRLGDDCTFNSSYIYSLLTRKELWGKLGILWKALYVHTNDVRKRKEENPDEGS